MNSRSAGQIIVALDVTSKKEALAVVTQLREAISFFKIGLQLYTAAGPEAVREIIATGAKVFSISNCTTFRTPLRAPLNPRPNSAFRC